MANAYQHERDARDLRILALLDEGHSQQEVAARMGVTRGLVSKLVGEIRKDSEAQ